MTDHPPLTSGNHGDTTPRWSPEDSRIAFLSDSDGKQQLYIRWMDSGQTARITNLDQAPEAMARSHDGKMLSFSALVPGKSLHLADLPSPPQGPKGRSHQPPTSASFIVSMALVV